MRRESKLEGPLERKCCAWFDKRAGERGYQRKYKSPGKRSAPDRIFACWDIDSPRVIFIEFKAEGEEATPKQKDEHAKMRRAGLAVYVCDDFFDFTQIMFSQFGLK